VSGLEAEKPAAGEARGLPEAVHLGGRNCFVATKIEGAGQEAFSAWERRLASDARLFLAARRARCQYYRGRRT
jgi:hypothetical protein